MQATVMPDYDMKSSKERKIMRMRSPSKKFLLLLLCLALVQGIAAAGVQAVSAGTNLVLLYLDQKTAFIGNEEVPLAVAPTIFDGSTYVPARFLGETMGFPVEWNDETRSIRLAPPGHEIELNSDAKTIIQNGMPLPFDSFAKLVDGTLLVKLTWLADITGVPYSYNGELRRVEMLVVRDPEGLYITDQQNSRPVAKFTTAKKVYRPGEPVKYIDLSYDPDAEGLVQYSWTGNQEVFFSSGEYPVTLQVADRHGNKSAVYTGFVVVEGEPYLTEFEYPFYTQSIGSFIKTGWSVYYSHFEKIPEIEKTITYDSERNLLVSDSPEEIKEPGVLYRDIVDGKSRLYAHHVNMSGKKLTFQIYARAASDKAVTLKTTNKGEVWPSIYANLIGSEATVDFLMDNSVQEEIVIRPGGTYTYVNMPTFLPGQGANVIYDIESDGPVEIIFAAQDTDGGFVPEDQLKPLYSPDHIRGTYPYANASWNLDLKRTMDQPVKLPIGNGKSDPFMDGIDAMTGQVRQNFGNWGMRYDIHIKNPPKMALMIMAKGGYFKGPIKVNGEIIRIPQSGVLTAFDGVILLARTTGTEESLDIDFLTPGGSNLPVDLIMYPLKDLQ